MDHLFNVHPGNGSVFLLKSLDREEAAWHNISVIATELRKSVVGGAVCRKMYAAKIKAMPGTGRNIFEWLFMPLKVTF